MEKLRVTIGNWIKDGDKYEQITLDHLTCFEFDPIPLTVKILEDWFDFQKVAWNRWKLDDFKVEQLGNQFAYVILDPDGGTTHYRGHCNTVHDFQNLYYALEKIELTRKNK